MNLKQIEIEKPAPVLNTPDFFSVFGGKSGREIPLNELGHPHHFEFVALPGMKFQLIEEKNSICQILAPEYSSSPLFLDARFIGSARNKEVVQKTEEEVLKEMKALLGTKYIWGGNWSFGIPEMLDYYPPKGELDERTKRLWTFQGIDCSGLLFQVLNGASPRNTSQLTHWGDELPFSHLSLDEILPLLKPLDMIVYPGHVLFVYDKAQTIESKSPFGVIQRNLVERLSELLLERVVVDRWENHLDPKKHFSFRRIDRYLSRRN